jgi:hypothetical protein
VPQLDLSRFLGHLEHQLESAEEILRIAAVNLAEEAIDIIKQEFADERDPYGDPWAPKKAKDGRKVLSGETGRLKTGWHPTMIGKDGFTINPAVDYAVYHQDPQERKRNARTTGEDFIGPVRRSYRRTADDFIGPMSLNQKPRKMVPDERGLPDKWAEAFEEVAVEVFREHFKG